MGMFVIPNRTDPQDRTGTYTAYCWVGAHVALDVHGPQRGMAEIKVLMWRSEAEAAAWGIPSEDITLRTGVGSVPPFFTIPANPEGGWDEDIVGLISDPTIASAIAQLDSALTALARSAFPGAVPLPPP